MSPLPNFYPHAVTGKQDDSFVGLKMKGEQIHLYYPETYRLDMGSPAFRQNVMDLLRTISIAKSGAKSAERGGSPADIAGDPTLTSCLWVIRDYLANGFYVKREKVYAPNRHGRVNWKRTMQATPMVVNGNFLYPRLIAKRKESTEHILVKIHRYCVKKSIDLIGWLFGLSSARIEAEAVTKSLKRRYVAALQEERRRTYDDEKRLRLYHLQNIMLGLDTGEGGEELVYGVDSYHYVFERMIDALFGNVKDLRRFAPRAGWQLLKNAYREIPGTALRPDTVLLRGHDVFILDAKFYRFGYTGAESDLPGTTSVQKQITYGDYIKKNAPVPVENVYNAFLLPYDRTRRIFASDDVLQYIGFAKSSWRGNEEKHELVHAFLIDLTYVVKNWNRRHHAKEVDALIRELISQGEVAAGLL